MRGWMLIAALALLALPAAARPRDEVMSGAFRCAAIADSRIWLDCYYGAAQPARAALGLPPVSEAQSRVAAAPPGGGVARDLAVRDDVMAAAFRCSGQPDEHQWLNCYYGAAQPMRAQLGLAPTPQSQQQAVLAAAPIRPLRQASAATTSDGGLVSWIAGEKQARVQARMTDYEFTNEGTFRISLDNGEVWYQMHGDSHAAHWDKPAGSYTVSITPGGMGSYDLRVQGSKAVYKVKRRS